MKMSLALVMLLAASASGADAVLPGTSRLKLQRPVDEVMVDGINRFCLRKLAASRDRRDAVRQRNASSVEASRSNVAASRDRFRQIIGATGVRVTAGPKRFRFELPATLEYSSVVARSKSVTAHAVRWQVLKGVTAEGLLLVPDKIRAAVVALPDADWTPEGLCGITGQIPEQVQFVRRLAEAGCLVAIPTLISRSDEFSGHPAVTFTNLPHREFIYRQAFEMGRHPIGFEVQKVLAAIDLFEQLEAGEVPVGVAGVGEGGLLSLYAAALDSRIDSTLVCGYFQEREGLWQEPIYRNVWRLLTEFGDAELAGMVAPRRLVIEACQVNEVTGPPVVRIGRRDAAAPGRIETCSRNSVEREFRRAGASYRRLTREQELVLTVSGEQGRGPAGSPNAVTAFAAGLGIEVDFDAAPAKWESVRTPSHRDREKRQFDELQVFVQNLMRQSHTTRDRIWKADLTSVKTWLPTRDRLQKHVHEELIGRLSLPRVPANPRTRLVLENDDYVGYEVLLDVAPDIIAAGILLLPRDLKGDEQRPVVVCQHGLEGTAMDTISRQPQAYRSYKAFAEELCRRGFIVFSPQNPYRGRDRFRSIQRKANPLGLSLFSFIIEQHRQTLDWLSTLPNVDADRIAFYGLSYGGKTAMRVPPFVDRYCLSICSGDFTDWAKTITTNEEPYGYLFTGEYEIPEWNLGHVASYAELALLMSPRPFMVEAGHRDGGQPTELVASEFGKVRRHYDRLKIADRAELEFFDGPHTINGQGTFRFLHRHLTVR
jgi:dienelactone hydrolase